MADLDEAERGVEGERGVVAGAQVDLEGELSGVEQRSAASRSTAA
ncbi:MAG: hypothetical protein R2697_16600 [Ilumatobacteraceae bacterium]